MLTRKEVTPGRIVRTELVVHGVDQRRNQGAQQGRRTVDDLDIPFSEPYELGQVSEPIPEIAFQLCFINFFHSGSECVSVPVTRTDSGETFGTKFGGTHEFFQSVNNTYI